MKNHFKDYPVWTKEELLKLISLWESDTADHISELLGRTKTAVQAKAYQLIRLGVKITRKKQSGTIRKLIQEVINES